MKRNSEPKVKKAYICGVSWQHEMNHGPAGTTLYPSISAAKKNNATCWRDCGIVELKVSEVRWVVAQRIKRGKR